MLSIIIPAYNEENRIGSTLEKIISYLTEHQYTYEILVVDDGSSDSTVKLINSEFPTVKVIKQMYNMGKGAAVRRGMLEAQGDIRLFTDADLSTPIYEIKKIEKGLSEGYEVCIGSRAADASLIKEHQPFYREFMGKTFNKIVQALVIKGIKDTQCGFKAFKKEAAISIFERTKLNGFSFDVEAMFLASELGYKVKEVPVEWYNDDRSKVSPVKDSIKMLIEIMEIRQLHKKRG